MYTVVSEKWTLTYDVNKGSTCNCVFKLKPTGDWILEFSLFCDLPQFNTLVLETINQPHNLETSLRVSLNKIIYRTIIKLECDYNHFLYNYNFNQHNYPRNFINQKINKAEFNIGIINFCCKTWN